MNLWVISVFFTVGKDEVRAWTITRGANAVEAAGKIHSDLARGFIRGECFSYEDLIREGSEKNLKEKGLFRLEGKTYIVKDGEILHYNGVTDENRKININLIFHFCKCFSV